MGSGNLKLSSKMSVFCIIWFDENRISTLLISYSLIHLAKLSFQSIKMAFFTQIISFKWLANVSTVFHLFVYIFVAPKFKSSHDQMSISRPWSSSFLILKFNFQSSFSLFSMLDMWDWPCTCVINIVEREKWIAIPPEFYKNTDRNY